MGSAHHLYPKKYRAAGPSGIFAFLFKGLMRRYRTSSVRPGVRGKRKPFLFLDFLANDLPGSYGRGTPSLPKKMPGGGTVRFFACFFKGLLKKCRTLSIHHGAHEATAPLRRRSPPNSGCSLSCARSFPPSSGCRSCPPPPFLCSDFHCPLFC